MNLNFIANVNKEGYVFIIALFLLSCISFSVSRSVGIVSLFITLLCIYFFRDPVRIVPSNNDLVVSPADGIVSKVEEVSSPVNPDDKVTCISIFLNVLNVHVNRIPVSGIIKSKEYRPGKFISATLDKSSDENERQRIVIENLDGQIVVVEQIAGLIARRIVCNVKENQNVIIGERFGIIRFGSRVNLYLPSNVAVAVKEGQTVVGGETIIANLKEDIKQQLTFNAI